MGWTCRIPRYRDEYIESWYEREQSSVVTVPEGERHTRRRVTRRPLRAAIQASKYAAGRACAYLNFDFDHHQLVVGRSLVVEARNDPRMISFEFHEEQTSQWLEELW